MSDDQLRREDIASLPPETVAQLLKSGRLEHLTKPGTPASDSGQAAPSADQGARGGAFAVGSPEWLASASPQAIVAALSAGELDNALADRR